MEIGFAGIVLILIIKKYPANLGFIIKTSPLPICDFFDLCYDKISPLCLPYGTLFEYLPLNLRPG